MTEDFSSETDRAGKEKRCLINPLFLASVGAVTVLVCCCFGYFLGGLFGRTAGIVGSSLSGGAAGIYFINGSLPDE